MTDSDRFLPHATVATVLENDGKFLLVEELSEGRRVLNQPAGHLEPMESLICLLYTSPSPRDRG